MRKIIFVAAVLAVLGVSTAARAEFKAPETVQEFLSACKGRDKYTEDQGLTYSYCTGVALGVMSTLQLLKKSNQIQTPCIPRETSNGQIVQAFLNWAEKNPTEWQIHTVTGFMMAIYNTWPCKK